MTTFDPHRCPDCDTQLTGAPACPACGLPLRGPLALELWQVSNELVRLELQRRALLDRLRASRQGAPPPAAPVPVTQPARPVWEPVARPAKPRREWTPQRVQNVILLTGVLVTLVAAVIFTAFQWGGLPVWARGGLMAAVTVATGYGARYVHRRGLGSSAEAIAALAVAFGAVDAYALHRVGFDAVDGRTYWAVATAVLAGGAAAFATVVPARSVRYLALALVQLPVVITATTHGSWTFATRGALFGAQAAALLYGARRLRGLATTARLAGAANWAVATLLALSTAWGTAHGTDIAPAAAILILVGLVPLLWPGMRTVTSALATASFVVALLALPRFELDGIQYPAAIAAVGLVVAVAAITLPASWRLGPLGVGTATVGVAVAAVSHHVLAAVAVPIAWVADPWSLAPDPAARLALGPGIRWQGSVVALGVIAVAAATAALVSVLDRRALPFAVAFGGLAVALTPLGFAWSYREALAWDVIAGCGLLAAGASFRRIEVALPGCGLLAVATAWSLADDGATLTVLGVVAVAFAAVASVAAREESAAVAAAAASALSVAVALSRGTPVDRTGFVLAASACGVAGAAALLRLRYTALVAVVAYAVALGLSGTGGWLAWTLALGTLATAGITIRVRPLAPVPAALGIACAGVTAGAYEWPVARVAFAVALATAVAVGVAALLRDDLVEYVAGAAYAIALVMASADPGWLSWTLVLGGLTLLANALRPSRRDLAWAGGLLLSASSWVRLAMADVTAPEAYAVPVAALALAFGHLRRRRDPNVTSWEAYGTGLSLGLGPTLWEVLFSDGGLTRPLLLAAVAVVVLVAGINERLQAPLTIGAVVLVLDALVQLAPVASALPKWATIGAAGLVVIAVGVTYEDRRRDVERLRETFDAMA